MDSENEKVSTLIAEARAMAVPSAPIIIATKPILVKRTGPVDEDNYPIYVSNTSFVSPQREYEIEHSKEEQKLDELKHDKILDLLQNEETHAAISRNETRSKRHRDRSRNQKRQKLNFEGKVLNQKWSVSREMSDSHIDAVDESHSNHSDEGKEEKTERAISSPQIMETSLLKPGTISRSEDDPLRLYGLLDSHPPHHFENQPHRQMIWISGKSVATEQEALHPAIDEHDPLYRLYDPSYFMDGDTVRFTVTEKGKEERSQIPTMVCWRKRMEFEEFSIESLLNPEEAPTEGTGTIVRVRQFGQFSIFQRHLYPDFHYNQIETEEGTLRIYDGHNEGWYDLHKVTAVTPSPLKQLFYIKATTERDLMAWRLKEILGDEHDWLTVIAIMGFIDRDFNHQRDIYFNAPRFEQLIRSIYHFLNGSNHNSSDPLALALHQLDPDDDDPTERKRDIFYQQYRSHEKGEHEDEFQKWWGEQRENGDLAFYQEKIFRIARRGHITFPRSPQSGDKDIESAPRHRVHSVLWCHELERAILSKQTLCVGSNDLRFCFDAKVDCAVYCVDDKKRKKLNRKMINSRKKKLRDKLKRKKKRSHGYCDYLQIQIKEKLEARERAKYRADDRNDYRYISADSDRVIPPRIITFKGGVVADDVGLGKTLTMLSLMAAHPSWDDVTRNSFHPQTGKLEFVSIDNDHDTIRCAASLVVAPSHLIGEWKKEIKKHFKDELLRVVTITTAADHKRLTYGAILEAHIVFVSCSFLSGRHYDTLNRNLVEDHFQSLSESHSVRNESHSVYSPFLELFHWRRLIVDEGHELSQNNKVRSRLKAMSSDFRWYLTATPFPTDFSVQFAAEYLQIELNGEGINDDKEEMQWIKELNKPLGSVLHHALCQHLFSRHTKESILSDHHLPDIEESCRLIEFPPIERALYDLIKKARDTPLCDVRLERKLCSDDWIHFERELYLKSDDDDINYRWDNLDKEPHGDGDDVVFWENYLEKLLLINIHYLKHLVCAISSEQVRNLKQLVDLFHAEGHLLDSILGNEENLERLQRVQSTLDSINMSPWDTGTEMERKLRAVLRKINQLQNDKKRLNAEYDFYEPTADLIYSQEFEEEIKKFDDKIRSKPNGLLLVRMMRTYGTKHSMLLYSVQQILEDQNNRIIMFSISERVLRKMRYRLHGIGIEATLCRGNVNQRVKAIKAFRGECRVILLSSNGASTGLDLTGATHVILVDTVPGSGSESFAAEKQAIGRAVRQGMDERGISTKVIRFVIADSIEQQINDRNQKMMDKMKDEEQKQNVERENMKYKLMHSLNLRDRTQSEIDFYVNIRKHAAKQMELLPTKVVVNPDDTDSKKSETTKKSKRKRKQSDKEEMDASSDDDEAENKTEKDDEPPPKKLRRS